jgi:mono/diheme cytochrome c family protein
LKKALKAAGAVLALLFVLGAGAFAVLVWLGDRKIARTVDVRVVPVAWVKDAASIRSGKYLYESRGCGECHGPDGHGLAFIDEPGGLYVKAPNITAGPGGIVSAYREADWVRAIRHGVNPRGHALLVMPSDDYNRLNDADFAALVAYVRSLPPVAGDGAVFRLPLHLKALYGAGWIKDSAEKIDHRAPPAVVVPAGATAEYGGYVANMCIGCHGPTFEGGPIAGAPPGWPPAADLTSRAGSAMSRYGSAEQFAAMMRSGKRPDGSAVSEVMPFASLRNINDTDLGALYAYLKGYPGEPKSGNVAASQPGASRKQ